jgi:hypothetical protein
MYVPDPEDLATGFAAEGQDLGMRVRAKDLGALKDGFLNGLRSMDRSIVESREAEAIGEDRLITMEARHTYREGEAIRKRWVRLLYSGRTQVRLVAQGSSPDEFDYWESMFFQSMRTFRFADWWAEATGVSWAEKPYRELDELAAETPTPAPGSRPGRPKGPYGRSAGRRAARRS